MSSVVDAEHSSPSMKRGDGADAVVAGLWVYPVQSLRGEALRHASFSSAGLLGDRGYGIADLASGIVVGASRPGWNDLITWDARYLGPVLADAPLPAGIRAECALRTTPPALRPRRLRRADGRPRGCREVSAAATRCCHRDAR